MRYTRSFVALAAVALFFAAPALADDDDNADTVLNSLKGVAQAALVCPLDCSSFLLGFTVCFLDLVKFDIDGAVDCMCRRMGGDFDDCALCVNDSDLTGASARNGTVGLANAFHGWCADGGYSSGTSLIASPTSTIQATDDASLSSAIAAAQTLSVDTTEFAAASTISYAGHAVTSVTYGSCPDGERWEAVFSKCMVNNAATIGQNSTTSASVATLTSSPALSTGEVAKLTLGASGSQSTASAVAAASGAQAAGQAASADSTSEAAGAFSFAGGLAVAAGVAALGGAAVLA
ncbi:hypothetical protein JCM8097_006533 [Rhodosporidiobolus ruineniae]